MELRKTMSLFMIHYLVIYLLGNLSLVHSFCPVRCLCYLNRRPRIIMCSKQGLTTFPSNVTDIVENLDLSTNLLTEITDDIKRLVDLQILNLARNQLNSLPESIGELQNLRKLDISENNIEDISNIASINRLPSLVIIFLSKNPLTKLTNLNSNVLQAVEASYCGIKQIDNTSLEGLPDLMSLSLKGNPLKIIQKASSKKLRWLDMSNCLLNYLNPDTFTGFPVLEELRLNNNPALVYSTRHSTLQHLNLKQLDVSNCNLDRPGLHGLPSLTHARLSRNTIRLLPNRIFAKNRQLTHLYLNSNGIEHLNISTFEGLVKLNHLDLSMNALEFIHSSTYFDNVELKSVNLSYNSLYQFPNLTSRLTSLDLSYNFIETLKSNSLNGMPKIKSLNLNDNRLQRLPNGLQSLTLTRLNIRRNRLMELNNSSFAELPELEQIDISGNRLTEAIDPNIFQKNVKLESIRLEDNPWRCDCMQLYLTYQYLTNPPAKALSYSLICQSPANVSDYTWESACYNLWNGELVYSNNRVWGFFLMCVFVLIIMVGTVTSIKHAIKMKRRAIEERHRIDRMEGIERLRLLQQRNQQRQERTETPPEPRIHPMELIGPPTYEEAVQMPRLTHSLDTLNEVSTENVYLTRLGSVDNLQNKRKRSRRPRKRTQSEDNLLRREERRVERLRRERSNSAGNVSDNEERPTPVTNPTRSKSSSTRRQRRTNTAIEELEESGSSNKGRPRPQTPSAKKKKRRRTIRDGHSTDDEDSDIQRVNNNRPIVIRDLRREPRSGIWEIQTECDS
ncbi:PREDICTED: leucine-rich repeat-containing protein 15 [Polistes dominula]|uniref:Leucine-rich repeat-containing protein 15 n=1 Tax=Polistes dominula TaxID=743375 RepID=A0ABM1J7V9_POLDO|nr:PREDICTED: leucine-rich repeat-containing protein 15 [Polistes dominula]